MTGSTLAARRAGIQHAASVARTSASAAPANVPASSGRTSNSSDDRNRVRNTAAATPNTRPIAARRAPYAEHVHHELARERAERDAHAELLTASGHVVRDHAVDADDREQQRDAR